MKKIKLISIILLMLISSIIYCGYSNAYSSDIEIDPKSLISMPWMVIGGSGDIDISSEISDYTLYYQVVEVPSDIYSKIKKNDEDGKKELESLKTEYKKLEEEKNNLKTELDKAKTAYETAKANEEDELESLKEKYDTAEENYNNKVEEYNNKIKEYNAKIKELNNTLKELTPTYIENNWVKTTDNKFNVDLSSFSGEKAVVVWVKLVVSDGTYYDQAIYSMKGNKVENTTDNKNTNTDTKNDSTSQSGSQSKNTNDKTIAKSNTLPYAGLYGASIIVIIVASISGIIFYKKYKNLNIK